VDYQLEQIPAYRRLSPLLASGGQPDASGIAAIARAGFKILVNLALPTSPGALSDEAALASQAGMHYVHLPIDFEAPEPEHASELYGLLERNEGEPVFVHCAKNMRVSALLSGYRMVRGGVPSRDALTDLHAIWHPNHTWRRYVSNAALAAISRPVHLETPRLILRDAQPDDAPAIQAYAGDAEVCRYERWGPNTLEQTLRFLQRRSDEQADPKRRTLELLIVEKTSHDVLGGATMHVTESDSLEAELGYVLSRSQWGRGIVPEACEKLLEVGFGWLGLHRIWASTDTENIASQRVLEKLGMRREAHFEKDAFVKGAYRSTFVYALTEAEYWSR
jgi:RimJ/RimL family protein N-acetyltransferase/protein tyrosine phosphatase (PTP) superfamily phosphohydrolase (DUF442 family)